MNGAAPIEPDVPPEASDAIAPDLVTPDSVAADSVAPRLATAAPQAVPLRSVAQIGLFLIALLAALYVTRSLAIPLMVAFMLYFLLRPLVRGLGRLHIPTAIGAALVLGGVLAVLGVTALELAGPAANWVQRLPTVMQEVEVKSRALRRPVERASHIVDAVEKVADVSRAPKLPQVAVAKPSLFDNFLQGTPKLATQLLIAMITAYFLLLNGDALLGRMFLLLPGLQTRRHALGLIDQVERQMSRYLATITAINVGLGLVLSLALKFLGMPNPFLWGGVAIVLNYVPYLGAAVGIAVVALVAFITFPTLSQAAVPPLIYFGLTNLEGNVISPLVLGHAFRISPLVMFVWLAFWAWLWSVAGAIFAVPLLMLLKIVAEQSRVLAPLARLMRQ